MNGFKNHSRFPAKPHCVPFYHVSLQVSHLFRLISTSMIVRCMLQFSQTTNEWIEHSRFPAEHRRPQQPLAEFHCVPWLDRKLRRTIALVLRDTFCTNVPIGQKVSCFVFIGRVGTGILTMGFAFPGWVTSILVTKTTDVLVNSSFCAKFLWWVKYTLDTWTLCESVCSWDELRSKSRQRVVCNIKVRQLHFWIQMNQRVLTHNCLGISHKFF